MFFNPRFNTRKYARRGFRLRGNTLVLLFVFFLIGLFLHYGGQTKPVVAFWNDVRKIVGLGPVRSEKEGSNPYKAPEPEGNGDVARDDKPDRPSVSTSGKTLFDFEKQANFILPAYTSSDEIIQHEGYTLRFRDEYKQADWVAYPLLPEEINGDAEREGSRFVPDPAVRSGSALPSDYTRSGYDRGHLAPAGDFKFSQQMMQETFFMSNMSPQAPDFNRGVWKELEEQVRQWALRDNGLYVVTGPVLKAGLPTIGKQNEVSVPQKFYKVLLYCNKPEIRMIGFLLNNKGSNSSLKQFVVPVDQIEQVTGIDFFPKLPDDLERKLESKGRSEMAEEWFSN
ncbi:DNA/RNA non-specific endonuclease [Spirosoma taeanense]|uniref:Endonuclease n=1 Tax=Spirosoma taeanense TaxID=2735870 RepID=A0A6M5YBX2_9BACT|nr:DNA/RNA non-specific endonuclease [Spirosoma taeanense]QJW90382.1 DNA/RNA non-specific endonuclease [Spirosoma taeanense]